MTWIAETLWDLLGIRPGKRPPAADGRAAHGGSTECPSAATIALDQHALQNGHRRRQSRPVRVRVSMSERYAALVREMKSTYGIRVRKWRSSSSGCAWEIHYRDGTIVRLIESPYPKGPMSCAIFLHEVGHHAIGFGRYRPRCLEEYHAWKWSIEMMEARGLNVTDSVRRRMNESLRYAVAKAHRRGLRSVPAELQAFV